MADSNFVPVGLSDLRSVPWPMASKDFKKLQARQLADLPEPASSSRVADTFDLACAAVAAYARSAQETGDAMRDPIGGCPSIDGAPTPEMSAFFDDERHLLDAERALHTAQVVEFRRSERINKLTDIVRDMTSSFCGEPPCAPVGLGTFGAAYLYAIFGSIVYGGVSLGSIVAGGYDAVARPLASQPQGLTDGELDASVWRIIALAEVVAGTLTQGGDPCSFTGVAPDMWPQIIESLETFCAQHFNCGSVGDTHFDWRYGGAMRTNDAGGKAITEALNAHLSQLWDELQGTGGGAAGGSMTSSASSSSSGPLPSLCTAVSAVWRAAHAGRLPPPPASSSSSASHATPMPVEVTNGVRNALSMVAACFNAGALYMAARAGVMFVSKILANRMCGCSRGRYHLVMLRQSTLLDFHHRGCAGADASRLGMGRQLRGDGRVIGWLECRR